MRLALETNTSVLEINALKMHVQTSATLYVDMIASHSYSCLKAGAITLQRFKRYLDAQWRLLLH